ncbi:MAG: uracil-DNA glycosylase family protein [Patescibacteria group bacterium]|nr:uracil-DNA glycosylase family protein [Patescibacteria group bacterium]
MHCIEKLYSDYTEKFLQDISSLYDIDVSPGKRSENIVYDETDLSGITHVVLGEAPGKEEVLAGLPFMGQAGKNLRSNIPEDCVDQTWITNVVKQRPIERTES